MPSSPRAAGSAILPADRRADLTIDAPTTAPEDLPPPLPADRHINLLVDRSASAPEAPSANAPTSTPASASEDRLPADRPADLTIDAPPPTPEDRPPPLPADRHINLLVDRPASAPEAPSADAPASTPASAPEDRLPADRPTDLTTDAPTTAPEDLPPPLPADRHIDLLVDRPASAPEALAADAPASAPGDRLPADRPADLTTDAPTPTPEDRPPPLPADRHIDLLVDRPASAPGDRLPANPSADLTTDAPTTAPEDRPPPLPADRHINLLVDRPASAAPEALAADAPATAPGDRLPANPSADLTTDAPTTAPEDRPPPLPADRHIGLLVDRSASAPGDRLPADRPADLTTDAPTTAPEDLPPPLPADRHINLLVDRSASAPGDRLPANPSADLTTDAPTTTPKDIPPPLPADRHINLLVDRPASTPEALAADAPASAPEALAADAPASAPEDRLPAQTTLQQAHRLAALALDTKAFDLQLYHSGNAPNALADYVFVCSGRSRAHVRGIAEKLVLSLKKEQRLYPQALEGHLESQWVVIDYGALIAHIFQEDTRTHYAFDELFLSTPSLPLHSGFSEVITQHPFRSVPELPTDPTMGLQETFEADPRREKLSLIIGVALDDEGKLPVMRSVKQAERNWLEQEQTKNYLGMAGDRELAQALQTLIFGGSPDDQAGDSIDRQRVVTLHTASGTVAIRMGAAFLHQQLGKERIWLGEPSWANHANVFADVGFAVQRFPYLRNGEHQLDMPQLLEQLRSIPEGDPVLLQACCHNPTGVDPLPAQWEQILQAVRQRRLIPFFDMAYQGLGESLDADAAAVRLFARAGIDMLVATSCSKNFSLYRERVGSLSAFSADAESAGRVQEAIKLIVRRNYSNPPSHGAAVARLILGDAHLRRAWEAELGQLRGRIQQMRRRLHEGLTRRGWGDEYAYLLQNRGMFSYCGLTPQQVERMRTEHGVYMAGSGRINLAGLTEASIEPFCEALTAVL